ncbi:L-fuconolactonase [Bacillus niacini]|uniref:L-fuconolactonase n=1 Tax=Neobacillus niacini TaxID=86668 RepID=A0A852T6L7_9BACI|nr:amidohydrolase family protein [Neobacillus niacini]NYE03479.1 L-fuconolactonase [Neobacillus niacini]
MRIDSHQHFWKLARGDYDWLTPEHSLLYRDYLPEDFSQNLQSFQMDKTIVVQAAPTMAETKFLLELYEQNDFIAGVVGWLDMESPRFASEYRRLKNQKGFVGIRPMLQDLDDDKWILRNNVLKNIELLVEDDFPIDLLIYPRHLPVIIQLLKTFPSLRAVINHLGKPRIAEQIIEPWKEQITEIASYQHVMCKLSGMVTEAGPQIKNSEIEHYIHHVVNVFGSRSVMFGSDWPVCLLKTSYQDVVELLLSTLPDYVTESDREAIFGENAFRFYKLTR